MYKKLKIVMLTVAMICMAACTEQHESLPTDRTITYTVESKVSQATLRTDAEWDELLDRFCTYSSEGMTVTFYNSSPKSSTKAAGLGTNQPTSISTTSRDEMKKWMKEMEKAGKTVTVTYDDTTGTWNGTAYLNWPGVQEQDDQHTFSGTLEIVQISNPDMPSGPAAEVWALKVSEDSVMLIDKNGMLLPSYTTLVQNDVELQEGDTITLNGTAESIEDANGVTILILHLIEYDQSMVVGRWHYYSMTTVYLSMDDNYITTDMSTSTPESMGNNIYFDFREDGTMTFTRTPMGSASEGLSAEGTWHLSPEGEICCEYFNGGGCWQVGCVANGLMVLYDQALGTEEGDIFYQMELHRTN